MRNNIDNTKTWWVWGIMLIVSVIFIFGVSMLWLDKIQSMDILYPIVMMFVSIYYVEYIIRLSEKRRNKELTEYAYKIVNKEVQNLSYYLLTLTNWGITISDKNQRKGGRPEDLIIEEIEIPRDAVQKFLDESGDSVEHRFNEIESITTRNFPYLTTRIVEILDEMKKNLENIKHNIHIYRHLKTRGVNGVLVINFINQEMKNIAKKINEFNKRKSKR